jgi:hypothetical protein
MMENFNYNLLEEITVRSKSIYRYETYIKEARAAKCFECTKVWRDMRRRQEEELDILLQHFKKHIDAGVVDFGSE